MAIIIISYVIKASNYQRGKWIFLRLSQIVSPEVVGIFVGGRGMVNFFHEDSFLHKKGGGGGTYLHDKKEGQAGVRKPLFYDTETYFK